MRKLLLILSVLFVVSCSKDPIIYTLTTSANPAEGGTVNQSSEQFNEGETATITAFPSYSYEFLNWSNGLGTSNSTTVVMDSDKSITANFNKKTPSKIKYEVEYIWSEKALFPYTNQVIFSQDCGGYRESIVGFERDSYDRWYGVKGLEYSLDSLIIDLRKVNEGLHIKITDRVETTGLIRKVPKKIGYIKVIGDTVGKFISINFKKASFQSYFPNNNVGMKPPIIYGDSNIDISNLFYNSFNDRACSRAEKITQDFFKTLFVKGDVSKYYGYIEVEYSQENDNLSIGDVVSGKKIMSDFKEYIYN